MNKKQATSVLDAAGHALFESDRIQVQHYFDAQGYAGCRCFEIQLKNRQFYAVNEEESVDLFRLLRQFQVFKIAAEDDHSSQ